MGGACQDVGSLPDSMRSEELVRHSASDAGLAARICGHATPPVRWMLRSSSDFRPKAVGSFTGTCKVQCARHSALLDHLALESPRSSPHGSLQIGANLCSTVSTL